jgi:hypothetical protein
MQFSMQKIKKAKANFMGVGARIASNDSGVVPNECGGMGYNYGRGMRNPMGKLRSDTVGYNPVSKKQLGTPPRGVV